MVTNVSFKDYLLHFLIFLAGFERLDDWSFVFLCYPRIKQFFNVTNEA